ncbi:nucleotidyltransferase domain-containing protein [Halobacterium sp. CBA1126]|uniref:nucleotidyltransferase domain-containing protein n=1 Tax=Halobacterium TaxID=2239 RepID=UPI00132C9D06|nr:hypothetical protein [Halobacterium sp. CBA1126]
MARIQAAISDAEDFNETLGVVVFGGVARSEADRQSDIDCFVVIGGDRTTARGGSAAS